MKNHRNPLLIGGLALLFFLAALIAPHLARQNTNTLGDLAVAQGQIVSYSFLDDSRGTHQYTIRLSGYPATFQIPADFAEYFAKARFESGLKKGDTLSVSIPADSAGKLTSNGLLPIFAARTKTATYLDEYYTVRAYNNKINRDNHNQFPATMSRVFLWTGVAFGLLGIGLALQMWQATHQSDPARAMRASSQRMKQCLTNCDAEQKSSNSPECPVCGAPAEKGSLHGTDSGTLHWFAGELNWKKDGATPIGADETAGDGSSLSGHYAEGLRCSSCRRITLQYGRPAGKAPQPAPVSAVVSSSMPG